MPALSVVAALVAAAWLTVDLEPRVEPEFFFGPGDPALRADQQIAKRFGSMSQLVVLASGPDISDPGYLERIRRLTEMIDEVPGIVSVHSLARGPDDLEDARESPLWRRLLLAGDGSTSFVIAELDQGRAHSIVPALEGIVAERSEPGFDLALAGVPYTVEVMRRELVRDFSIFSGAAVVVFGLVILVIFRSGWILAGTLATCVGAVAGTLLALQLAGFGIGLLTANLTTIVFVLAQAHVVFMTTNWQQVGERERDALERVRLARAVTLRASLGSAATTLLGFGSLLFVPAHPLRELGAGGSLGAAIAFVAAYLVMPFFLEQARPRAAPLDEPGGWAQPGRLRASGTVLVCLAFAAGLAFIEADPSLLSYFDDEGGVYEALETLDRAGGSSPLALVVQRDDRARLDSEASYEGLQDLQRALEADPAVGRVVALPLLIAEARRVPLSFLLSEDWILDLIGPETTGAFLTADRRQTLYVLQMQETGRDAPRREVLDRLDGIARSRGFEVPLTGGIYKLQARLAELVSRSLLWSLAALAVLFAGVATFAGASLRLGLAAGLATALVPVAVLGAFGVLAVPLDVIAAPAASVGFGLAADAALHLIAAWRRRPDDAPRARWRAACAEQGRGIARATGIVALGFGLFALSSFPPSRRFGLAVAASAAMGAVVALWLLPMAARLLRARRVADGSAVGLPQVGGR